MHPDIRPSMTPVWAPWRFNLGDHWQTVNYLLTRSFVLREEQVLSRYQHGEDHGPRFKEILALINGPERSCVTLVDEPGVHEPDGFDVWAAPSWPTHLRWERPTSPEPAVFQFDGISSAKDKNPSESDQDLIVSELTECAQYYPVKLGLNKTLKQCVEVLARTPLFIGCDSGMSHLAHAVGCPTIIVEYDLPIITCHRGKHFMHARGTDEALALIRRMFR